MENFKAFNTFFCWIWDKLFQLKFNKEYRSNLRGFNIKGAIWKAYIDSEFKTHAQYCHTFESFNILYYNIRLCTGIR